MKAGNYSIIGCFFFLEGRPHTIVCPTLCASSHAPKILPFLGLYIAVHYIYIYIYIYIY